MIGKWVETVVEPTAVFVLGLDRSPLEGESLGLPAW